MGRKPCCDKVGIKRGPWTIEEDHKLMNFIVRHGIQCWRSIPKMAGLLRCGKSCRLRWINYLRPDLKRGGFTEEEEDQIIQLHETLGNRWSKIASHFEGRTDNEIKNHWNTKIKKRLKSMFLKSVKPKQTTTASSEAPSVIRVENNLDNGLEDFAHKIAQNDDQEYVVDDNEDDLLKDYEIFNGSLEVIERWLNEESIENFDGQSSSGAFQESLNVSMSEFSPELLENQNGDSGVQHTDEYLHQWFDYGMDPFFRVFNNHLEDQLLFPEKHDLL